MNNESNRRILLIDDNPAIHEDFKKVLGAAASAANEELDDFEAALFGDDEDEVTSEVAAALGYEISSAFQGQEAIEMVAKAREEGRPFAMAFVDVRMPPGLDGVQTIARMWEADPNLQAVICTAFSDYTWGETIEQLGRSDRLLILKKPFDPVEACQIACALVEKWNVTQRERLRMAEVKAAELEARSYAASLETVNRALETTLATAEASARAKSDFLLRVTDELLQPMAGLLGNARTVDPQAAGEEWIELLEAICHEGGALRSTLDDIVDLSHIEAGDLEADSGEVRPMELVQAAVSEAAALCGGAPSEVEVRCETPVPARIQSDPGRLHRVIVHLLQNAYARSGGGAVKLVLATEGGEAWTERRLRIDVIDHGQQIPRSRIGQLFEPFQEVGDLSLGLSLSRRVAHLLGGDLSVTSDADTGTVFRLTVRTGALDGVSMLGAD